MNKSYHKPAFGRRVSLPRTWFDRVARARISDKARAILLDMLANADSLGRIAEDGVGYFERPDGTVRCRDWGDIRTAAGQLIQAGLLEEQKWLWEGADGSHLMIQGYRIVGAR